MNKIRKSLAFVLALILLVGMVPVDTPAAAKVAFSKTRTNVYDNGVDKGEYVLDIDLDIFSKDMDYIPYELKISKIKELIEKSKVITIASSPFFINQEYAIKVLKELFNYDII